MSTFYRFRSFSFTDQMKGIMAIFLSTKVLLIVVSSNMDPSQVDLVEMTENLPTSGA